jgi:hypothetical protein
MKSQQLIEDEFDDLLGDEPLHDVEDQWDIIDIINNLTERDPQVEQQILRSQNPEWAEMYKNFIKRTKMRYDRS